MRERDTSTKVGGIGFTGLLTIAFIVLKLCGVISWSWVWVLAPIWIDAILVTGLLAVMIIRAWRVERGWRKLLKK